ncbi:hypothetical protein Zmor_028339, partial [Zophobas morio]
MTAGGLFVGYDYCSVFDALEVTRCYKCNKFGHSSQSCKAKEVCPRCSEGHKLVDCKATTLKVVTLDARLTIIPINRPKKIQTPAKKSPLFSIVIKDVDQDIEERDIVIRAPHLKVHKMWRIISRKTNKPTLLIRLISDDVITINTLLTDGIVLFGRLHRCEPSNAPPPTPVQCSKCFTLGHQASECSQKPICPRCTGTHAPNKCPKEDPECPFCKGPHPAWSRKCPEFLKLTVTDETQT